LREHEKSPVREVVVDHFGHLKREGKGRADQEQGEDMKDFKALAREMNVPLVVLMQLNRGVESRADKRPMLSDLRECGAAEEDADVVAMLYRDAYYNPTSSIRDYAEIFLRKNRDGDPGEIWTKPCLPEMRFDECEPQARPNSSTANAGGHGSGQARGTAGIQSRPVSGFRGDN
jgi:replicative DNA helicase